MYITNDIKYVGVDDKTIDLFESQYVVPEGISYNSYVIFDKEITIMDTVDARATKAWTANIDKVLDGCEPTYLVISHLEPDHAASIKVLTEKYPNMKLVGNAKTFQMFPQFFEMDIEGKTVVVKEGDTLSIGSHTLSFYMAPMVHWPEVMVTYDSTDKVLFSADGFGKFGVPDSDEDWACEARRYYFNIVGKYGAQVQALLKKAAALDIQIICPLHGPVLSENLEYYIDKYNTWSSYVPEDKGVLIAYASIHGNTKEAALKLAEILEQKGIEHMEVIDLSRGDMAEAVEGAFRYDKMVLASATYDGGLFPVMEDFLSHLKSKNYQKRNVYLIENGSWAPMAAKKMSSILSEMKEVIVDEEIISIKSVMKAAQKNQIESLADKLI